MEVHPLIVAIVDKIVTTGDKIVAIEVQPTSQQKVFIWTVTFEATPGHSWCSSNYCALRHDTEPIQSNFNRGK